MSSRRPRSRFQSLRWNRQSSIAHSRRCFVPSSCANSNLGRWPWKRATCVLNRFTSFKHGFLSNDSSWRRAMAANGDGVHGLVPEKPPRSVCAPLPSLARNSRFASKLSPDRLSRRPPPPTMLPRRDRLVPSSLSMMLPRRVRGSTLPRRDRGSTRRGGGLPSSSPPRLPPTTLPRRLRSDDSASSWITTRLRPGDTDPSSLQWLPL
mmetsp:Transcript_16335/g.53394  ORF Transcript_16335/g.53394 Transcript_16335/m.53394 type:complete len:207 (+) Transcript_16335:1112-1732(+)